MIGAIGSGITGSLDEVGRCSGHSKFNDLTLVSIFTL